VARKNDNLFQRLTHLFRSGPVIKRRVKAYRQPDVSTAHEVFKKTLSHVYSTAMSAYGTYDRMARYSDYSEMEYCLAPDTLIAVPGGFRTIEDLAEEHGENEEFVVYAYDHNLSQIVPALAKHARQTRVDQAFKVTFDSGKEIVGTGNHRLMLRDGTYRRIDSLRSGDAMMPFYRRNLYSNCSKESGYQWIYTMDPDGNNGWTTEHKLIAEWASGRRMTPDEVVHHRNFVKDDNRPENLEIMTREAHSRLHQILLNGKKWNRELNREWIEEFKRNHSAWMRENNPARRRDITFGRILEICEREGFNSRTVCDVLDTDPNVIKRRLRENGFDDFVSFARAYDPEWRSNGWNNRGSKNPRYDDSLTFQMICDAFESGMPSAALAAKLNTTQAKVLNRVRSAGFKGYGDFKKNYRNHRVVSVEPVGIIPLYDLTVDGYKNFATDSVISHNTPEIASALDIYSEESASADDKGQTLHVYSENRQIKQILNDLFYDTLNVEFNLTPWVRDLVKYGDLFLFNDVSTQYGVQNVFPIPVNEVEREEGFDPNDPLAVRFRWVTQGNQVLENWQVTHMRLLGNDAFLPYGSSVLESARRIWRQLILIEDAMLVYRVIRSPERRVFYIDVGNVPPEEVATYMEQARSTLRSNQVIDQQTGRVDLRYNPLSVDEDYFIPIRGAETGTKIETLPGGTNITAIEDVEYIQKKLFAALKVPKAYLGYDDTLSSKATLSQEDIRFSRSIHRIQRVVLSELNKLAIIHLFCHGYEGEDLLDFELKLSNPSTIAQQQKLELYRTRFDIAAAAPEGIVDRYWIRKNIMGLTDDEIDRIENGRIEDKKIDQEIEQLSVPGEEDEGLGGFGAGGGAGGLDLGFGEEEGEEEGEEGMGDLAGDLDIGDEEAPPEGEEEEEDLEAGQARKGDLLTGLDEADDDDDDDERPLRLSIQDDDAPVKAQDVIDRTLRNRRRQRHSGPEALAMPDLHRMTSHQRPGDSLTDPYDKGSLFSDPFKESSIGSGGDVLASFMDGNAQVQAQMTSRLHGTLQSLEKRIGKTGGPSLISERENLEELIDLDLDLDLEGVTLLGEPADG